MDEEEDDDIFGSTNSPKDTTASREQATTDPSGTEKTGEDLEEGEEEGEEVEESDSVYRSKLTRGLITDTKRTLISSQSGKMSETLNLSLSLCMSTQHCLYPTA